MKIKTYKEYMLTCLDILICPITKQKLQYDETSNCLVTIDGKIAYKMAQGIPILLREEAIFLSNEDN